MLFDRKSNFKNLQFTQQIHQKIRDILLHSIPGISPDISDGDDIFSAGIDSVDTMMLITELEHNFSISMDDDIPYENFEQLQA